MKSTIQITVLSMVMLVLAQVYSYAQVSPTDGFVYTDGSKFMLDGRPYYFSGANVYDLFTYGGSYGDPETEYMDKGRIDAHMRRLYRNGIRVVRLWGFSHEEWHGFEIEKGVYNEPQFMLFDYIVKSAEANGIKLIVALENYWNDYGGIKDRLKWEGIDVMGAGTHDQGQFFTNLSALQGYKDYVEYFITRINHYDGLAYKDDPTILAWELMNEPRYQGFGDDLTSDVLRAWVDDMGQLIKSIDSKHLLGTGLEAHGARYGFGGDEGNDFIKIHQSPWVDFSSAHPYIRESWSNFDVVMTKALICQWAEESHDILNKPLYVGEFNVERNERLEWWHDIYGFIEEKKIGASAFWWFPDDRTPEDKFAVFEGDAELDIYKSHSQAMETMSGGEVIYLSLLSPRSGSKYVLGSDIEITANSINADNSIAEVSFYNGNTLLGTDATAPFSVTWQNAPNGNHSIYAIATTTTGITQQSTKRDIEVGGDIFSLEYRDASSSAITNAVKAHFKITNQSSVDIPYEDLSIRYWFTSDSDKTLTFTSDYSELGTSYVSGEYVNVGANNYYLQVNIAPQAGVLESFGNSGRIEAKIHYSDWSDMDQSNDYSYGPQLNDFTEYDKITVYLKGQLIYGVEPGGADVPKAVVTTNVLSGDAPLLVAFDGSGSTDPNGDVLAYSWDFGDGSMGLGPSVTHEYTAVGEYVAKLIVEDPNGNTDSTSVTIDVTDPNKAPVAVFNVNAVSGIARAEITFDASLSTDVNGDSLTYFWDFGDGMTTSGSVVSYVYSLVGQFEATLTVSDGNLQSSISKIITITDGSPVAAIVADKVSGFAPLEVSFDASSTTNPSGGLVDYNWSFGDGGLANGILAAHTFVDPGTYNVSMIATNDLGKSDTASMVITVRPPVVVSDLVVEYKDGGRANSSDNMINPHLKIVNNGSDPIDYRALTLRYWFTSEDNASLNFWCDWAQLGSQYVQGVFGKANGVDFLEISFAAQAGSILPSGNSGPIQARFAKSDWSPFNELDDYSYNATLTDFAASSTVTLYSRGALIWGVEPPVSQAARLGSAVEISPSDLEVYPNPAKSHILLSGQLIEKGTVIRIVDTRGAVMLQKSIVEDVFATKLSMDGFKPGIYLIEVKSERLNYVERIVKE